MIITNTNQAVIVAGVSLASATIGLAATGSTIEARTAAAWAAVAALTTISSGVRKPLRAVVMLATLGFAGVIGSFAYGLDTEVKNAFILASTVTTAAAGITAGALESKKFSPWQAAGVGSLVGSALAGLTGGVPSLTSSAIGGLLVTTAFTYLDDQPPEVQHHRSSDV